MPNCRWPDSSLCAGLWTALALMSGVAQAGTPDWFGPACSGPAAQAAPQQELRQLFLLVRTRPDDAGSEDLLLRFADGRLWAQADSLARWNVPAPAVTTDHDGTRWYALDAVHGVRYRFDDCTQELWLDTSAAQPLSQFSAEAARRPGPSPVQPGAYLNLDAQYVHATGAGPLSGLAQLGLFNRQGYGNASLLDSGRRVIRLDSSWVMDDVEQMRRLTLGDAITRPGVFGRAVRFGGVQWGREFSLQPDLITFPQPSLRGEAALPSSVEVYVNQMLRSRQEVPAGPFQFDRIPVVTGQGDVRLVVRDVLGREQLISSSFYSSPQLLRVGLHDYTVAAGWMRYNYAQASADYGRFLGAATFRNGFSSTLTGELHGEAMADRLLAGTSAIALWPRLGTWSAGLAASRSDSGAGVSTVLGFERIAPAWSFSAESRWSSAQFRRIGDGAQTARRSDVLRLGAPHRQGSLSLVYLRQRFNDDSGVRILGLNYSLRISRDWYLSLAATDTRTRDSDSSYTLGLTHSLGTDVTASVQREHDAAGDAFNLYSIQRSMPGALGLGLQAQADDGASQRRASRLQWSQERGIATADITQVAGMTESRLGYSTGAALLGRSLFWTRPLSGSFAVVEVPGTADVRVYADERYVGRTDAGGELLVPGLRAYEVNTLRIEDADLPMSREVTALRKEVVPAPLGGVRVAFPVSSGPAYSLRLRRADGSDVPAGARLRADGAELSLPVGFGGLVYLSGMSGPQVLEATWSGGRCRALIDPRRLAGRTAQITDVSCAEPVP